MKPCSPAPVRLTRAPGCQGSGTDKDFTPGPAKPGYEFNGVKVHSDDFPIPDSSGTGVAEVQCVGDEDDPHSSIQHHFTGAKHIVQVKQCDPSAILRLSAVGAAAKDALDHFLRRHAKFAWMRDQDFYVQKAALAAAHDAMHTAVDDPHESGWIERYRSVETHFDVMSFLKCGLRIRRKGYPPFWKCGQVELCPRCNLNERVKIAKDEFLPAFGPVIDDGKAWFGITVIGRSNPKNAGVKIKVGEDDEHKPVYSYLFRPSGRFVYPKLTKFSVSECDLRPRIVSEALLRFLNWLTDGRYFDGLQAFRDISLTFFPDRATGVRHTVNCHWHGYGNTSRQFTHQQAKRMWMGCARILCDLAEREAVAYPDITFHPIPTAAALETAMNYIIKPFKFANWYLNGLKRKCPLVALNREFFLNAFECEEVLAGTKAGSVFGNMSQKSRPYYIGKPPPVILKRHQIERFLELQDKGEAYAWEYERYQNHLKLVADKNRRKQKQ
jgi:hypothetical protein